MVVTLRCLASSARPPVSRPTTPSFQARSRSRSIEGGPNAMPFSLISLVSAMTLAACSSALDGMQPTLRQTPPRAGSRSTSTTRRPRSAARNAAVYPPGPAPRSSTSAVWFSTSSSTKTSEHEAAHVLEQMAQVPGEPRGQRPVDDPVVVGQRDRQHQPRYERRTVPDRRQLGPDHAEDGYLGGVDDGREGGPADAAQAGDREAGALQVGRPELALPGPGRDGPEFPAEFGDALAVHVADHRHHQALGRVHGDAEVVVALVDQRVLLRRQRAVELGE